MYFPKNRPESFLGLSVDSTFASYSSTVVHRLPALRGFAPTPVVENSEPKFRFGSRLCENACDWRPDCVRSDTGEDLADRRGKIARIEPREHLMTF
jgi:hypothetical protein